MIKLIHKDCLKAIPTLKDDSVDLIVTSPPYFNARNYAFYPTYQDYLQFLTEVFTLVYSKVKAGRMVAVNLSVVIEPRLKRTEESTRYPIPFHFVSIMEKIGYKFIEDIIWQKPEGAAKNRNGGFFKHRKPVAYKPNIINEYILIFQKPSTFLIDKIVKDCPKDSLVKDGYERTNIWKINPATNLNKLHSAPFPIELPKKLIEYYSFTNDTILDMFMGIGTTAIACRNLNRNFIGIEVEQEYFNSAVKRMLDFQY